jgi:hypothetical protein
MMATTFLTEKSTAQSEVSACDGRIDAFLKRKQNLDCRRDVLLRADTDFDFCRGISAF